jgi:hypothetical protein
VERLHAFVDFVCVPLGAFFQFLLACVASDDGVPGSEPFPHIVEVCLRSCMIFYLSLVNSFLVYSCQRAVLKVAATYAAKYDLDYGALHLPVSPTLSYTHTHYRTWI